MALAFGIPIVKIDINTYFHKKPLAFGIYAKYDVWYQSLGEIPKFWPSSIPLSLVGEMT